MNRPLRVAVADDEPDIRDYFRKLLPRLGHEVVAVAGDGQELIDQCRAARPDLVITDLKMPQVGGLEAADAICRERPTPVILMSAHFDPAQGTCAEAEHVLGHLGKPIRQAELRPLLELALRRFRERHARVVLGSCPDAAAPPQASQSGGG